MELPYSWLKRRALTALITMSYADAEVLWDELNQHLSHRYALDAERLAEATYISSLEAKARKPTTAINAGRFLDVQEKGKRKRKAANET